MKILVAIFLLILSFKSFSQQWVATPNGLRNAEDAREKFVMINGDNLSAKKLYDNAVKYILANNPDSLQRIKMQWDSTEVVYNTFRWYILTCWILLTNFQVEAYYTTELRFYPGSVRCEIVDLDMVVTGGNRKFMFTRTSTSIGCIYNKHGKLVHPEHKAVIEAYFNDELLKLAQSLNQH